MSHDQAVNLLSEASETGEIAELLVFITDHLRLENADEGLQHICASLFSEAETLCTTHFGAVHDRALDHLHIGLGCPQRIDAREVMTHLLVVDIAHSVTLCMLPSLIAIWRKTYSQLILDTLRRKRGAGGTASISTVALAMAMQAWTSELVNKVNAEVLPKLIPCDAYIEGGAPVISSLPHDDGAVVEGASLATAEVFVVRALIAVLDLCDILLTEDTALLHATTLAVLGVCRSRPHRSVVVVDSEVHHSQETVLTRCTSRLSAHGLGSIVGIYDEQLDERDVHFSDFLYEDSERGKSQTNEKVLALLQAREAELNELTLFSDDNSEAVDAWVPALRAYTSLGSLCILSNSLLTSHGALLLLSDPSSVFTSSVPLLVDCLKTTSVSGILFVFSFLHGVLSSVPKYSLVFAGEEAASFLWSQDYPASTVSSSLSFKTKRYEALFNLLKQLIIISSTCQSANCREQAKYAILSILILFNLDGRARLQSSLIALCPYPSVVTFLLNDLFCTWREYNMDGPHWASVHVMEDDFPLNLYNAMLFFHKNILLGQAEFADPLVASINFLYVFLALDSKQHTRQRLSYVQQKICWSAPPKLHPGSRCSWPLVFQRLRCELLPQLNRLLDNGDSATVEVLRPIDAFALTSALDMLKTFF